LKPGDMVHFYRPQGDWTAGIGIVISLDSKTTPKWNDKSKFLKTTVVSILGSEGVIRTTKNCITVLQSQIDCDTKDKTNHE
jgi:hypothetical protein